MSLTRLRNTQWADQISTCSEATLLSGSPIPIFLSHFCSQAISKFLQLYAAALYSQYLELWFVIISYLQTQILKKIYESLVWDIYFTAINNKHNKAQYGSYKTVFVLTIFSLNKYGVTFNFSHNLLSLCLILSSIPSLTRVRQES